MKTALTLATLGLLAFPLQACGGADGAPAKTASPSPEPRTIEEAQAQIADAKAELGGSSSKSADTAAKEPAEPAPPPPPEPPKDAPREERSSNYGGASSDACMSPCRALASMKRAVEALCRMTGDTDARCKDARLTLTESASRAASCKCG